ncbi:MAG: RuvB-like domain-containing protein, partial [Candidatus Bathyarchaeia archaeon]
MSGEIKIREVETRRVEARRIGIHSHVTGLGLDKNLRAIDVADGLVGQKEAREAAGIIVHLIKQGKRPGHGLLLVGPPGTGKTAIAIGMARELGQDVPFVAISGSEIYGLTIRKAEFLRQAIRRAIGVRIKETKEVYEGEVVELEVEKEPYPYNPYIQIATGALITLATKDETKTLEVGERIANKLLELPVRIGDVIEIDAETGWITKIGRAAGRGITSKGKTGEYRVARVVERPSGPVRKTKTITHTVTLHDIDIANIRLHRGLLFREEEVSDEIRQKVDEYVNDLIKDHKAELVPGVLFIDEAHMLDVESFAFLSRALEEEFAPVLVLATNRAITTVKGTDIKSPHGIPIDMLDRLLIARTRFPTRDEIMRILDIRAEAEDLKISKEALEMLTDIGEKYSLRHASQLMLPAKAVAEAMGDSIVEPKHIERVRSLFIDTRESVEYLKNELAKDAFLAEFL